LSQDQLEFAAGILGDDGVLRGLEMLRPEEDYHDVCARLLLELKKRLQDEDPALTLKRNLLMITVLLLRGPSRRVRPAFESLCLSSCDLTGTDLSDCDLVAVDFSDANLSNATLKGATLTRCVFAGAAIDGADLTEADLTEADFRGVQPPKAPPLIRGIRNRGGAILGDRERQLAFL
jgi:hypothetical protein